MAGVFKTTSVELLHNLTSVLPISYVLNKLTHSYSLKLQGMVPNAKTRIILYHNLCQYWPEYIHSTTNLTWAFLKLAESMYWPLNPATTRLWGKLRFTYLLTSPPYILVGVAAGGGIRYTYYMLCFLNMVTTLPLPAWTLPAHSPKATRTCFSSILFSVSYHFLWHPFALLSHITAHVSCLAPQSFCNSTEVRTLIPLLCIPQIAYSVP